LRRAYSLAYSTPGDYPRDAERRALAMRNHARRGDIVTPVAPPSVQGVAAAGSGGRTAPGSPEVVVETGGRPHPHTSDFDGTAALRIVWEGDEAAQRKRAKSAEVEEELDDAVVDAVVETAVALAGGGEDEGGEAGAAASGDATSDAKVKAEEAGQEQQTAAARQPQLRQRIAASQKGQRASSGVWRTLLRTLSGEDRHREKLSLTFDYDTQGDVALHLARKGDFRVFAEASHPALHSASTRLRAGEIAGKKPRPAELALGGRLQRGAVAGTMRVLLCEKRPPELRTTLSVDVSAAGTVSSHATLQSSGVSDFGFGAHYAAGGGLRYALSSLNRCRSLRWGQALRLDADSNAALVTSLTHPLEFDGGDLLAGSNLGVGLQLSFVPPLFATSERVAEQSRLERRSRRRPSAAVLRGTPLASAFDDSLWPSRADGDGQGRTGARKDAGDGEADRKSRRRRREEAAAAAMPLPATLRLLADTAGNVGSVLSVDLGLGAARAALSTGATAKLTGDARPFDSLFGHLRFGVGLVVTYGDL
jgi:hypothetical protein